MIRSADVMDREFCGALCFMEPNCFSYNLVSKNETGKLKCELNNATHEEHEEDLEENQDYLYRGAKVRESQTTGFIQNVNVLITGHLLSGYFFSDYKGVREARLYRVFGTSTIPKFSHFFGLVFPVICTY